MLGVQPAVLILAVLIQAELSEGEVEGVPLVGGEVGKEEVVGLVGLAQGEDHRAGHGGLHGQVQTPCAGDSRDRNAHDSGQFTGCGRTRPEAEAQAGGALVDVPAVLLLHQLGLFVQRQPALDALLEVPGGQVGRPGPRHPPQQ